MMGQTARHQIGGIEDTQEWRADPTVWKVSPWAIDQAPCVTFAQVSMLAMKQGADPARLSGAIPGGRGASPRGLRTAVGYAAG